MEKSLEERATEDAEAIIAIIQRANADPTGAYWGILTDMVEAATGKLLWAEVSDLDGGD